MLVNTLLSDGQACTTERINQLLKITSPPRGLTAVQVKAVIETFGLDVFAYDYLVDETAPNSPGKAPESGRPAAQIYDFWYSAYSFIESGLPAFLHFTTSDPTLDHLVTIFGHTTNFDEWHPHALPAYFGPSFSPYLSSCFWADHLLIHDDNLGPYFSLSRHVFTPPVSPRAVIGVRPSAVNVGAKEAELTSLTYTRFLTNQPTGALPAQGDWWMYMRQVASQYCFRTMLVKRDQYIAHVTAMETPDGVRLSPSELQRFNQLPDLFWMCEISLPDLFTANKSKLGEALVECATPFSSPPSPDEMARHLLAIRLPSLLLVRDNDVQIAAASSIMSHVGIFRRHNNMSDW
jgi:hypothetical protein